MMRKLFFILLLITQTLCRVEIIDLESLDWIAMSGEKTPILRIVIHGENVTLPLREAPFCHLAETEQCECFILRKEEDSSDWQVASFVKCGDELRGNFVNSKYRFEMIPKEYGESGQHIVKIYAPENDFIVTSAQGLSDQEQKEKTAEEAELNFEYLKPLPEYGELFENETGYITIRFVLDEVFDPIPEPYFNALLQNFINDANRYLMELNVLAIYEGWTRALDFDKNLTDEVIRAFVGRRYRIYDEENDLNAVILFGEFEGYGHLISPDTICTGPGGIFIAYRPVERYLNEQLKFFLYSLGRSIGLPKINITICDPDKGHLWIMEDPPRFENLSMRWSDCTKEVMQKKVKKNLACLKRKIKPKKPFCGNGWVDEGEQCDCITVECQKFCINCRLTEGSECYNGPCCDKLTCMFADNETQCRAADDSCDIPELCDGKSSECPADFVVANGYKCQESPHRSYCYRGKCGSRSDMCQWAFQNASVASDSCYKLNTENGKHYGGCGPTFQSYRTRKISYDACEGPDMYCGKIFCYSEGGEQGEYSYTPKSSCFFSEGVLSADHSSSCVFIQLYLQYQFLQEDPTLVPNGSECAPYHMCVNQKCTLLPRGCPQNCPGVQRVHPFTKRAFPAHEIDSQPRKRVQPAIIWPFFLVGLLMITAVCGAIYFICLHDTKFLSDKRPSWLAQSSFSQETDSRSIGQLIRSAFRRRLTMEGSYLPSIVSEETSTVKDKRGISKTV